MPDLWLTRCRGLEPLTRNVDPTGIVVRSVAPLLQLPGGRFAVQKRRELPRAVWAATTLLGIMPPAMLAASRVGAGHTSRRVWARTATRLLSIDLHLSGVEHIDPAQHYVVVPLHEGFADIPALLHLPLDLTFAVRSQLLEWRVLGRHLRTTRQVSVDPETPVASYRRLLRAVPAIFGRGESLVVFPQGAILGIETAFSPGAFRLAEKFDAPILPVVLTGSHRVWEHPFSPRVRFGQPIALEVLAPIRGADVVANMTQVETLMKQRAQRAAAPPRRFVPERDGWWDDYRYEIDPAFPDLAERVARHRDGYPRSSGTSS